MCGFVFEATALLVCWWLDNSSNVYYTEDTKMRKAFIFDFDDTLAVTDAKIRVFRDCDPWSERFVASLSPREFSSYELKTGEHFDFL